MLLEELKPQEVDLKGIAEKVGKDCKPFFDTGNKEFLYRGAKVDTPFFVQTVRKDRRPLHSDLEVHKKADAWFKKKFGYPYRSGSLMSNGNSKEALACGNLAGNYTTKGFPKAVKSGKEVMLACDRVYMIKSSVAMEMVQYL